MIEAKRIHEFTTATATELKTGTPVIEVEVFDGTLWRNRKTPIPSTSPDIAKRSSTSTAVFTSTQLLIPWQTELIAGTSIVWSGANPTRITLNKDGRFSVGAAIAVRSTGARAQIAAAILKNGTPITGFRGGSYMRNAGTSWDYWVLEISPEPFDFLKDDYIEIQIGQVQGPSWDWGGSLPCDIRGIDSRIWVEGK